MLQDPVVRPISELGPKALQELLPEIPLWVKTPDYERVSIVIRSIIFFFSLVIFQISKLYYVTVLLILHSSAGWLVEQVFTGYVAFLRQGTLVIHMGKFLFLLDDSSLVIRFEV